MLDQETLKKIRHIEIHTRRLLSSSLAGDSRSALKGTGFEFDQIREYQLGDDIRFIDWKSSSRTQKILVKQYTEERSRSIMIAADVSQSAAYGSTQQLRREVIAQMVGALSLVAAYGNDRVGVVLFSDDIELAIPLSKGLHHARFIMEKIFTWQPKKVGTNINVGLSYLASLPQRDTTAFLLSDFIDEGFEKKLRVVAKKHDLVALRCLDSFEKQLPACGFIEVEDSESGATCMLDMRAGQNAIDNFLYDRIMNQDGLFKKYGVDVLDVALDKPFINDLIRFFRRRMMY